MIDTKSSGVPDVEVIECRDVAFLPTSADGVRALALSRNGCSVSLLEYDAGTWKKGNSCRPILGIECDENYVESLRLFVASTSNSKCGLIVVGKKHSSNKSCILCGPFGTHEQVAAERWTKLLPEMSSQASQPCFWLEENEEVLSLICLPYSEGVQQKIALSTSSRVLLLSLELSLLAQTTTQVSCGALSPMGASTVSFCSSDSKIRYLCCLKGKFSTGTLATLRLPNFGYCSNLLLAVRSDRFLYTALHSSGNLIGYKENADCFMLPTAFTKPAILLEPLVANAVTEIRRPGASTPLLRAVIEKFGRKVASITHGDEEGIGNRGAGITPRVYEILYKFGLKQAASWLLTGGVHFERQTNTKILPPWMPLSAKKEAALNSDAFLHLVSNGDQYLSEYIQSPDHNMPSSLPRTADATPYSCREFSQEALAEGNAADVLKMLDMVGTESSDSMLLQLSLLLEIKSGDTTELLKTLSGYDQAGGSNATGLPNANKSLAALSVSLKLNELPGGKMSDDNINRWMKPLAPSLQRGTTFRRVRQRLLGESALDKAAGKGAQPKPDPLWQTPCNESRHLW